MSDSDYSCVRVLAVDLDDTLLRQDLTISDADQDALRKAEAAGVTVLLASGRVPESIEPYSVQLGMDRREGYMIAANGALLLRSDTHQRLFERTVPVELALRVFHEVDSHELPIIVYQGRSIRASRENRWVIEDTRLSKFPAIVEPDYSSFLQHAELLKLAVAADPSIIAEIEPAMRTQFAPELEVTTTKPFFLEFLPKGVDKGEALRHLISFLDVAPEEVMAVGDSMNDLGMVREAGISVAVANACDEVKAAADIVLERNHEQDAVAEAIHRLILRSDCY
jgi:hypothetical protein